METLRGSELAILKRPSARKAKGPSLEPEGFAPKRLATIAREGAGCSGGPRILQARKGLFLAEPAFHELPEERHRCGLTAVGGGFGSGGIAKTGGQARVGL